MARRSKIRTRLPSNVLESNIRAALVDEINDETAVDNVLMALRNWKHGSYTIHTPEALPDQLRPNDAGDQYAHYAQTHELVCKEALSIGTSVRNDNLDGDDPSIQEVRALQYIHGLSRCFLREHLSEDGPFTLHRGVGGVAFADVGRQLIDDEGPLIEVNEKAALANFSPSKDVAKSFRGLILSLSVSPDAIAVAADQLFKCTDEHGDITNRHAEVRVVTDCYRESASLDDLRLPSNTKAHDFLQNPHTDNLEDHRFMASLLNRWFNQYDSSDDRPIPQTTTGFDRIEEWHTQYQNLLETRQREALEQENFELADRLSERLTIVDGLTKTADTVRDEQEI
ncbi:hypothetical protein [Halorubrum sp. AS12]|uniref:hypothetical protein n=1 Tax=Halorubrum sp. AS12 TaxID=3409687 RepID=UPI003DA74075